MAMKPSRKLNKALRDLETNRQAEDRVLLDTLNRKVGRQRYELRVAEERAAVRKRDDMRDIRRAYGIALKAADKSYEDAIAPAKQAFDTVMKPALEEYKHQARMLRERFEVDTARTKREHDLDELYAADALQTMERTQ